MVFPCLRALLCSSEVLLFTVVELACHSCVGAFSSVSVDMFAGVSTTVRAGVRQ